MTKKLILLLLVIKRQHLPNTVSHISGRNYSRMQLTNHAKHKCTITIML